MTLPIWFESLFFHGIVAVGGFGGGAETAGEASSADYVLLGIFFVIAIGFSFYCSVAEATLLSISPSYIATLSKRGHDGELIEGEVNPDDVDPKSLASAKKLKKLKDNVDRPLAAILSLNTIAHTIGAAGVGAQSAKIWGSGAVGIASALMTLAILVLSEIIPKTIGALYWRKLAGVVATSVNGLILLLLPLVWISELLTKVLSGGQSVHAVTREEFTAMADLGVQHGLLAEEQSTVLSNLIRMRDIRVNDIRTPRTVLIAKAENQTVDELLAEYERIPVSRIPIHEGDIDKITGMVLRSDVLRAKANGLGDQPLQNFRRDVISVQEDLPLLDLMQTFLDKHEQLAIVVDEFGGTEGVVTLEDLVETLFGIEIVDEHDTVEDLQKRARDAWQKRAEKVGLVTAEPTAT